MNAVRRTSFHVEEEKHLLRALLYFDIFDYPLTALEVAKFSGAARPSLAQELLDKLEASKIVFQSEGFYSIQNNPALVLRRLKGNALAATKMKTAERFARIVSRFPFVRAVMLSGSISKNYMEEKSDIDYFIITEENRLWIVRTALALFRRVFLFNSHKNLCTNYFIDRHNLEIAEQNIFTAVELRTMIPLFGRDVVNNFYKANEWATSFLPNYSSNGADVNGRNSLLKKTTERLFAFKTIDKLNDWLMNRTIAYWKRKYQPQMASADFKIAFRSTV